MKLGDNKPKESKSEESLDDGPPKYTKSILKKKKMYIKPKIHKKRDVVIC